MTHTQLLAYLKKYNSVGNLHVLEGTEGVVKSGSIFGGRIWQADVLEISGNDAYIGVVRFLQVGEEFYILHE